MGRLVARR